MNRKNKHLLEFFTVLPVVAFHVMQNTGSHVIVMDFHSQFIESFYQLLVVLVQAGEILLAAKA